MTGKKMVVASVRDHHSSYVQLHLSSGHGKFLLEVFSIFHQRQPNYSAHWSGRRGSRFNPQIYQPCPHTHSLFSFSWLNPSVEDCAHHKHRPIQIQAKHFKAMQGSPSTELSMSPRQFETMTEDLMPPPDCPSYRHKVQHRMCPPSPPSPLCCAFFLAETTLCYRSR